MEENQDGSCSSPDFGALSLAARMAFSKSFASHAPADQAGDGQHHGIQPLSSIGPFPGILSIGRAVVVGWPLSAGAISVTVHERHLPSAAT